MYLKATAISNNTPQAGSDLFRELKRQVRESVGAVSQVPFDNVRLVVECSCVSVSNLLAVFTGGSPNTHAPGIDALPAAPSLLSSSIGGTPNTGATAAAEIQVTPEPATENVKHNPHNLYNPHNFVHLT